MKRNTGKGSEKQFEALLRNAYGKQVHIFRIVDSAEVKGRTGKALDKKMPSDYIVTAVGRMYYAEVKSTDAATSFSFSCIQSGQKKAMIQQRAAGGDYFVFIHRRPTDEWFKLPAPVILDSTKSSITWEELNPYRWEL